MQNTRLKKYVEGEGGRKILSAAEERRIDKANAGYENGVNKELKKEGL